MVKESVDKKWPQSVWYWYDGLPIHAIKPGHFINSIEWISIQKIQETQQDFGWEQQILVYPDEDSVFIKVNILSYFKNSYIEATNIVRGQLMGLA